MWAWQSDVTSLRNKSLDFISFPQLLFACLLVLSNIFYFWKISLWQNASLSVQVVEHWNGLVSSPEDRKKSRWEKCIKTIISKIKICNKLINFQGNYSHKFNIPSISSLNFPCFYHICSIVVLCITYMEESQEIKQDLKRNTINFIVVKIFLTQLSKPKLHFKD